MCDVQFSTLCSLQPLTGITTDTPGREVTLSVCVFTLPASPFTLLSLYLAPPTWSPMPRPSPSLSFAACAWACNGCMGCTAWVAWRWRRMRSARRMRPAHSHPPPRSSSTTAPSYCVKNTKAPRHQEIRRTGLAPRIGIAHDECQRSCMELHGTCKHNTFFA